MDPVSIVATVFTVSKAAVQVSSSLYTFVDEAHKVDRSLRCFIEEVAGLKRALDLIEVSVKSSSIHDSGGKLNPENITELWSSVYDTLVGCRKTLEALNDVLVKIRSDPECRNPLRKAITQIKLNLEASSIIHLRSRVQTHSTAMQLALTTINVYVSCCGSQVVISTLEPKLDLLLDKLREFDPNPTLDVQPEELDSAIVLEIVESNTRLKEVAKKVHSNASVIGSGSTGWGGSQIFSIADAPTKNSTTGSEVEEPLSGDQLHRIKEWNLETLAEEEDTGRNDIAASSSNFHDSGIGSDSLSKIDPEDGSESESDMILDDFNILVKLGDRQSSGSKFGDAEKSYRRALRESKRLSVDLLRDPERHYLSLALARTLLKLEKVDEAKVILEPLSNSWMVKKGRQSSDDCVTASFLLAELYLQSNELDHAERCCKRVLLARRRLLGKDHPLHLESVHQRVRILTAQGENELSKAISTEYGITATTETFPPRLITDQTTIPSALSGNDEKRPQSPKIVHQEDLVSTHELALARKSELPEQQSQIPDTVAPVKPLQSTTELIKQKSSTSNTTFLVNRLQNTTEVLKQKSPTPDAADLIKPSQNEREAPTDINSATKPKPRHSKASEPIKLEATEPKPPIGVQPPQSKSITPQESPIQATTTPAPVKVSATLKVAEVLKDSNAASIKAETGPRDKKLKAKIDAEIKTFLENLPGLLGYNAAVSLSSAVGESLNIEYELPRVLGKTGRFYTTNEALEFAILNNEGDFVVCFVMIGMDQDVESQDAPHDKPLHLAARKGRITVLKLVRLDQECINIDTLAGSDRVSALLVAVAENQLAVVKYLLDCGADTSIQTKTAKFTALNSAAKFGFEDIVHALLDACKAPIGEEHKQSSTLEVPSINGDTPLITAAYCGHLTIVRLLLKAGAKVEACNEWKRTALREATDFGHETVAKVLLKAGASPKTVAKDGKTPLIKALELGNYRMTEILSSVILGGLASSAPPAPTATIEKQSKQPWTELLRRGRNQSRRMSQRARRSSSTDEIR